MTSLLPSFSSSRRQGGRTLFVGVDVCLMSLSRIEGMRRQLCELLGLEDELLVTSTIHSHSCPNGLRDDSLIDHDTPGYADLVTGLVVQAASKLPDGLVEVTPQILATHVRGWYSNRNSIEKPFDDEAFVIRFVDAGGKVVAAMQNFNCHSTVVGPTNMLITSDLQGAVRAELAEWLGVVPYAFTGASGDLGTGSSDRQRLAELKRVSCGIAAELMKGSFEPCIWMRPLRGSSSIGWTTITRSIFPATEHSSLRRRRCFRTRGPRPTRASLL